MGEAFRVAYAQQRLLAENRRASTQTETKPVESGPIQPEVTATDPFGTQLEESFEKRDQGYSLDSGLRYVWIANGLVTMFGH